MEKIALAHKRWPSWPLIASLGAEDLATRRMCKKPAEALSVAARGENNSKITGKFSTTTGCFCWLEKESVGDCEALSA